MSLTRNCAADVSQKRENRKLCDVIAASNVVYNCVVDSLTSSCGSSTSAQQQRVIDTPTLARFLSEQQREADVTSEYVINVILVCRNMNYPFLSYL